MDTFKVGTYPNIPGNLEKGCSQTPSHPGVTPACSMQRAWACDLRSFFKYPLIILFSTVASWFVLPYGKHTFSRLHHVWDRANGRAELLSLMDDGPDGCVASANWTTYHDQPPWTPYYPNGAETTLSLPLDSDALYLLSRGPSQRGLVSIEQSTEVADTVDVRVRVAYYDAEALERVTVCRMQRAETENGVGIFTRWWKSDPPHQSEPEGPFRFDVTLTLPAGAEDPLSVKDIETDMPNYSQDVGDLQESVVFERISLRSANGRLSVQSLTSEVGEFVTVNGEIDGHFNTRSTLDLHTSNGHITPTVNLLHREGANPPGLTLQTANGKIDAELSLAAEGLMGGEFDVDASSTNGVIGLRFADTPVDSILRCRVQTTVGDIEVELDDAFEGTYSLQSILGAKAVSQRDVEDPAGRGRHRVVSQSTGAGRVEGEVKWVESDGTSSAKEGNVVLAAVLSSIKLVV